MSEPDAFTLASYVLLGLRKLASLVPGWVLLVVGFGSAAGLYFLARRRQADEARRRIAEGWRPRDYR